MSTQKELQKLRFIANKLNSGKFDGKEKEQLQEEALALIQDCDLPEGMLVDYWQESGDKPRTLVVFKEGGEPDMRMNALERQERGKWAINFDINDDRWVSANVEFNRGTEEEPDWVPCPPVGGYVTRKNRKYPATIGILRTEGEEMMSPEPDDTTGLPIVWRTTVSGVSYLPELMERIESWQEINGSGVYNGQPVPERLADRIAFQSTVFRQK